MCYAAVGGKLGRVDLFGFRCFYADVWGGVLIKVNLMFHLFACDRINLFLGRLFPQRFSFQGPCELVNPGLLDILLLRN